MVYVAQPMVTVLHEFFSRDSILPVVVLMCGYVHENTDEQMILVKMIIDVSVVYHLKLKMQLSDEHSLSEVIDSHLTVSMLSYQHLMYKQIMVLLQLIRACISHSTSI